MSKSIVPMSDIGSRILFIRDQRVILDVDLARVYGVKTSRLNEQVKRNIDRFPDDFCFQLTERELGILISQNATSSHGGLRKRPFAFTEHGCIMPACRSASARRQGCECTEEQASCTDERVCRPRIHQNATNVNRQQRTRSQVGSTGEGTEEAARCSRDRYC